MNIEAISNAVNRVQRANGGRAFVTPSSIANNETLHMELLGLLGAHGVRDTQVYARVPHDDLAALYASTLKDTTIGAAVSQRIAAKYARNPIMDDKPVQSPPRMTPPPVQPDPFQFAPPVPSPDVDLSQYAKRSYVDQKHRDAREAVERDSAKLRSDFTDTMLKVTEALPGVIDSKLQDRLPEAVRAHVADAIAKMTPTRIEIVSPDAPPVPLGLAHNKTATLIKMLSAGVNVYLHGPAGSGKTTGARMAATAFNVPFYFAAKVESEYMLLGFKDARGETVRTQFREAYEHGGVFLFDEMDASSPAAIVALNAALANGICPFPDGTIHRHPNFKCIGAGNTKLSGATREYVGRSQMDAASIDRFAFLEWAYDDALEMEIAGDKEWCRYVQAVRVALNERALKHLVSPRASYDGSALLASGFTWEEVQNMTVWKGLDADTIAQVSKAVKFERVAIL